MRMADLSYTPAENDQCHDGDRGVDESTEQDISRDVDPVQASGIFVGIGGVCPIWARFMK